MHTTEGFYSAVAHRQDPNLLIIRARSRGDLERLRKRHPLQLRGKPIERTFAADYPYRMYVQKAHWADIMLAESEAIDYANFKSSLNPEIDREGRHQTLLRVWQALMDIEYEPNAKCRKPRPTLQEIRRSRPDLAWPYDWDQDKERQLADLVDDTDEAEHLYRSTMERLRRGKGTDI